VNATASLRVVHVDTARRWGGGQRQLHALATAMQQGGHCSWVAARPLTRLASELVRAGVRVVPLSPTCEWDPVAVARLRAALRQARAQVVHAHDAHAVAVAALAVIGLPVRLVASRRVALPLRRNPLSRWKYAQPARFIAVSDRVRAALAACGVAAERVTVVRSGVDLSRPSPRAADATLRELGVEPGRPLAVMVSALDPPHKDPVTFLAGIAAARHAGVDVQALLVGDGPLAGLARQINRELRLEGIVHLAGYRTDAIELLAAADVAVLTSRDEGLGTSLLDAMLAGVPVVATAAGGVREVVRDGVDGLLVPVGDGAALGGAICRVVSDAALRRGLVENARRRVTGFSIQGTIEGTLAVYRRLEDEIPGRRRAR